MQIFEKCSLPVRDDVVIEDSRGVTRPKDSLRAQRNQRFVIPKAVVPKSRKQENRRDHQQHSRKNAFRFVPINHPLKQVDVR